MSMELAESKDRKGAGTTYRRIPNITEKFCVSRNIRERKGRMRGIMQLTPTTKPEGIKGHYRDLSTKWI